MSEDLAALSEAAPAGRWWFDGRDIFTDDGQGAAEHHLVVPLPDTWHESQRVSDDTARFICAAVNDVRERLRNRPT